MILEKLSNGTIEVTGAGDPYTLLSTYECVKNSNGVRIENGEGNKQFDVEDVERVISSAGGDVEINGDIDLLYTQLRDYFFFKASTSGGGGGVNSVTGDGVDNSDPSNPVVNYPTVFRDSLIFTSSYTTQQPTLIDTPFYPTYGNGVDIVTDDVTLSSNGVLTIHTTGQYYMKVVGHFGRTGGAGTSICPFWGEINLGGGFINIPNSNTKLFTISNSDDIQPFAEEYFFELPAGVQLRYAFLRDSSGNNSGGLFTYTPNVSGLPPIPSLGVEISKLVTIDS